MSATSVWQTRLLSLLTLLAGCAGRPGADHPAVAAKNAAHTVILFAAASTAETLNELREQFERDQHAVVRASYGASSTLALEIAQGAPADVFVSASEEWADHLAAKGLVAQRYPLLENQLALIMPARSKIRVSTLPDLLAPEIRRIALGDPESAPAGIYARRALTKLDLWELLRHKVVSSVDVRQALAFVETGAAEAGIVYVTDAAISTKVIVVARFDIELSGPIHYPAVLLAHGRENPAARQFVDYLRSEAAAGVFRKHGFLTVSQDRRD
jgi:molybdate transport system substrate-binding protein